MADIALLIRTQLSYAYTNNAQTIIFTQVTVSMLRSALQLEAKKKMVRERRKQMKNWVERAPTTDDNDTVDVGKKEIPQERLKRMKLTKQ